VLVRRLAFALLHADAYLSMLIIAVDEKILDDGIAGQAVGNIEAALRPRPQGRPKIG